VGGAEALISSSALIMPCSAADSANGVILENNTFFDFPWGVQPDGNGFATFGSSTRVSERLSFSRNLYQGMFNSRNVHDGSYPHEAFTSDGTGGAYAGKVISSTSTSIDVPGNASSSWVGAALAVVAGQGQGQLARITAAVGSSYSFAPALAVSLGAESVVVVVPYVGKVLMMGNIIRNSTTIQIFGSGFDTVRGRSCA
jgi:hypothetical protein